MKKSQPAHGGLTLVLGSGAREHALAWRLSRGEAPSSVFLHPGNAGTRAQGFRTLGEGIDGTDAIIRRCRELGIDLVVIGPEALLAEGYADCLREGGLAVVGPNREGAKLETSKVFAKEFLTRAEIPTASYSVAHGAAELLAASKGHFPIVLKLDGLAAGKGVVVARTEKDVQDFCRRIWDEGEFGPGPHAVVVEEFLAGREISYIGLCDGNIFLPLSSATDFKRVGDGDAGPNTGGMGAVSPSPFFTPELEKKVRTRIVDRVLARLSREKLDYRGVLYVGLIVTETQDPYVLEFNARFGDPETQAILMRLEGNFRELLRRTAQGRLNEATAPSFAAETAIYVVAAAEGYPGKPASGDPIEIAKATGDSEIFFAGVCEKNGRLATSGGRVLGAGALGRDIATARERAYRGLARVRFRGMHFRKDIGGR